MVTVAVTGIPGSTPAAAVTGAVAAVLTLKFTVVAAAPGGLCAAAVGGQVGALVNQGTITFLSNSPFRFFDLRGNWSAAAGALLVGVPTPAGLYAVAAGGAVDWVNTAPLSGANVTLSVVVYAVYATPRATPVDAAVQPDACTPSAAGVLAAAPAAGGCAVVLTPAAAGGGAVRVAARLGGLNATAALRVWLPTNRVLTSTHRTIQRM